MMKQYFFAQTAFVEVSVYFSRRNAFVPQHGLYCPQIGSSFEQMRGERMAECVRTYLLLYSCCGNQLLYDIENHNSG